MGTFLFSFFLVKKNQNKPTSKQKHPRFGCKIFGNSLTFLTECFCVHSKVSSKSPQLLFKGNLASAYRLSIDSFTNELSYYPFSLRQCAIWYINTIEKDREGTGLVSGQKNNLGYPSWRFTGESVMNFSSTWKTLDSVRDKGRKCGGNL